MFDFLEDHEVFDRSGDLTLVHFVNQVMDTAVLVKNYGKGNEEVFVVAGDLEDYPTTLADAADYEWVHPDDRDWSQDDCF